MLWVTNKPKQKVERKSGFHVALLPFHNLNPLNIIVLSIYRVSFLALSNCSVCLVFWKLFPRTGMSSQKQSRLLLEETVFLGSTCLLWGEFRRKSLRDIYLNLITLSVYLIGAIAKEQH